MSLTVLHPGLFTTIQDRGRAGFRRFGVPMGGAADRASLDLANALLGNDGSAAAIEWTGFGGRYRADKLLNLAIAGVPLRTTIERSSGQVVELVAPQSFTLFPGDVLQVGGARKGLRLYLAVAGGWQTACILGSRSSELPIALGDTIEALDSPRAAPVRRIRPVPLCDDPLRLLPAPGTSTSGSVREFHRLFRSKGFRVLENSNRVGLRLDGIDPPSGSAPAANRRSAPVVPGTLQNTGSELLLLGVAGGTMGGYEPIAQVITADLDRMGQLRPGETVRFEAVDLAQARRASAERTASLRFFHRVVAAMCER